MTLEAIQLPAELILRAPTLDDAQAVADLIAAIDIDLTGEADISVNEINDEWNDSNLNLATDAWVVTTPDGEVVGYEIVSDGRHGGRINADGYVHPAHRGRGIGTTMIRLAETRARQFIAEYPDDVRVCLQAGIYGHEDAGRSLLENEGFRTVRHFWRMGIQMDLPPTSPKWPDGIQVRTFVLGQDDYATYSAIEEAFSDHWGHVPTSFEEWKERNFSGERFNPDIWFLAIDQASNEIAGASLCRFRMGDSPWLSSLSVRRKWRGRGVGMALLRHTFSEFYGRGFRKVALGVDAQSLTGATVLYERAGMTVLQRYDLLEKELRAGTVIYRTEL